MTIHSGTDHAGFALKEVVKVFLETELGYDVVDHGSHAVDEADDYPDYIRPAAAAVAASPEETRAIIFGGSGQGEAMVANRINGVRATVFYGEPATPQTDADGAELSIIAASRRHNNANVLSLGARFLDAASAKTAVAEWLETEFTADERHVRRIAKIDQAVV